MSDDPFAVLGLPPDATADDVHRARRRLARDHHPDLGGDGQHMRRLNVAVTAALTRIATGAGTGAVGGSAGAGPPDRSGAPVPGGTSTRRPGTSWRSGPVSGVRDGRRVVHDAASFTIEALPVEAFEALLVVTTWIGETLVDDPPYLLETHLYEPVECWCRLELVPDAGSSTVSLTVAAVEVGPAPDVDEVRDRWVAELNRLDWDRLEPLDPPPPS